MAKQKSADVSEFAKAALELDQEFLRMERLGRELERLTIPSDKGLDRGQTLLAEVDACRLDMAARMQAMALALETARMRNEAAEKAILEKALVVQESQKEANELLQRFQSLAGMVRQLTEANQQVQQLKGKSPSPEDVAIINSLLPKMNEQIGVLVDEAQKLMDDSRKAHLKSLERNADSLRQSLQGLRTRLSAAAQAQSGMDQ